MATYKYDFNAIEGTFDLVVDESSFHVKDPVDTYNDLPVSGNAENDMRFAKDTDDAWVWTIASESGDITNWKKIPLLANLSLSIIAGDLDDITNGTTYGKVKNTEIQDGLVKYVDDGTTGDTNRSSAEDIADAVTKKHTQNTDPYLNTQVTQTLYVDGNRGDTYTANGSITKPFKTVQSAINQVITNADNTSSNPYLISIAVGTPAESLTLNSLNLVHLTLFGEGEQGVVMTSLSSTSNNSNFFSLVVERMEFTGTITVICDTDGVNAFGNACEFNNCNIKGDVTFKNINCAGMTGSKQWANIIIENVPYADMNSGAGQNPGMSVSLTYDDTLDKPLGAVRCNLIAVDALLGTFTLVRGGSSGLCQIQVRQGSRVGHSGSTHTVGTNCSLLCYNSNILGNVTNNGTITNTGEYYNNATSGLTAKDSQSAIDELKADITAEDIWDSVSGDIIQPKNANSPVELGTGYLDAGFYKIGGVKTLHTPGTGNVLVGENTGNALTTGTYNIAIGYDSLVSNTTGDYNIAIGFEALKFNISGANKVALGYQAGRVNTGSGDIFIGYQAGLVSTNGGQNTFLGYQSGYSHTNPSANTYVGYRAGFANISGANNVYVGSSAGINATGAGNTFVGAHAGNDATTGGDNTYLGYRAGYSALNRSQNTCLGTNSGRFFNASNNIFIGFNAGHGQSGLSTGTSNISIGIEAGKIITTGNSNIFIGFESAKILTTGATNTLLGYQTGYNLVTGGGNVFLGYQAGYNEAGSNKLYISNSNTANPLIYGEFDNNYVRINGELDITGELGIKVYEQASEPDLGDEKLAMWIDTDDSNRVYIIFSKGTGSQLKVELT